VNLGFFSYFLQYYVDFLSWIFSLFWWDFPFFRLYLLAAFCVCVYLFITLVSGFVYFGRAGSLGVSLAGRVIFSFCAGLRCVECLAGTIYLSASLGWVAGLNRFSSFSLCCGEYGATYLSAGQGWLAGLYRFSAGIIFCLVFS
jgi:hypothetical protein